MVLPVILIVDRTVPLALRSESEILEALDREFENLVDVGCSEAFLVEIDREGKSSRAPGGRK